MSSKNLIATVKKFTPLGDTANKNTEVFFDSIINGLMTRGLWNKLDIFYLFVGNSNYWKNINWKSVNSKTSPSYAEYINLNNNVDYSSSFNNQTLKLVNDTFLETDKNINRDPKNVLIGVLKGPVDINQQTTAYIGHDNFNLQLSTQKGITVSLGTLINNFTINISPEDQIRPLYYKNNNNVINKYKNSISGSGAGLYMFNTYPDSNSNLSVLDVYYNNTKILVNYPIPPNIQGNNNGNKFTISTIPPALYSKPNYVVGASAPTIVTQPITFNTVLSGSIASGSLIGSVIFDNIGYIPSPSSTINISTTKFPIIFKDYFTTYKTSDNKELSYLFNPIVQSLPLDKLDVDYNSNTKISKFTLKSNTLLPDDFYWFSQYPSQLISGSETVFELSRAVKKGTPPHLYITTPLFEPLKSENIENNISQSLTQDEINSNKATQNFITEYNNFYFKKVKLSSSVIKPLIDHGTFLYSNTDSKNPSIQIYTYPQLTIDYKKYTSGKSKVYGVPCKRLLPPAPPEGSIIFAPNVISSIGFVKKIETFPTASSNEFLTKPITFDLNQLKLNPSLKKVTNFTRIQVENAQNEQFVGIVKTGSWETFKNFDGEWIIERQKLTLQCTNNVALFDTSQVAYPTSSNLIVDMQISKIKQPEYREGLFQSGSNRIIIKGVGLKTQNNVDLRNCYFIYQENGNLITSSAVTNLSPTLINLISGSNFTINTNSEVYGDLLGSKSKVNLAITGSSYRFSSPYFGRNKTTVLYGTGFEDLYIDKTKISINKLDLINPQISTVVYSSSFFNTNLIKIPNRISGSTVFEYKSGSLGQITNNRSPVIVNHGGTFDLEITSSQSGSGKLYFYENDTSNPAFFQTFPFGTFIVTQSFNFPPQPVGGTLKISNLQSQQGFYIYVSGSITIDNLKLTYANSTQRYAFFYDNELLNLTPGNRYVLLNTRVNPTYVRSFTNSGTVGSGYDSTGADHHYMCVFAGTGSNTDLSPIYDLFYQNFAKYLSSIKNQKSNTLVNTNDFEGIPFINVGTLGNQKITSSISAPYITSIKTSTKNPPFQKDAIESLYEYTSKGIYLISPLSEINRI